MPELNPINLDAINIWNIVQRQRIWLVGMGGATSVDLDHNALWKTIEKYKIKDEVKCFEKVLKIFARIRELEEQESNH